MWAAAVRFICAAGTLLAAFSRGAAALSKDELCAVDMDHSKYALNLITVAKNVSSAPRILCLVNTMSIHHTTRVQAIRDTWGQRCAKLLFFSNATDSSTPDIIQLDTQADHNHLWQKHKRTLQYVWDHHRFDGFDWFYKSDDDAYVVVDNLQAFLRLPEVVMQQDVVPLTFGCLTPDLVDYYVVDKHLRDQFKQLTNNRWVFNSGGPGYAMNPLYVQTVVESLPLSTCLSDRYCEMLPDDAAISFCMAWHNVYPSNTRDLNRRERWHADKPRGVYFTDVTTPTYWLVQYHDGIGGAARHDACCSPESVAFHYVLPPLMYHLERQLYYCRSDVDLDLAAFNTRTGLAISSAILEPTPLAVDYGPVPDL
ncbi:hypothetical protein DYB32_002775 [Aphanomyces invadans]|uniref:N-acetylgalactosaminide beta-1,3-galactosyltransferase n=1 Tax=Aphanomyces invadans TaxID=157072 RepID=A0A3R6WQ00_9STRA|nr:hypothetical protein DYB32_002775 [Aphanomyces invadans]